MPTSMQRVQAVSQYKTMLIRELYYIVSNEQQTSRVQQNEPVNKHIKTEGSISFIYLAGKRLDRYNSKTQHTIH